MCADKEKKLAKARALRIYADLLEGKQVRVEDLAAQYHVSTRSIHRDIGDIRELLDEEASGRYIDYDRMENLYKMNNPLRQTLKESQVFAVVKMLLECRCLTDKELTPIIKNLVDYGIAKDRQTAFLNLINEEKTDYKVPQHKADLVDTVWKLQNYASKHQPLLLKYVKVNGETVKRRVVPKGIMFSEFYFYMLGFNIEADGSVENFPLVYRVDRISDYLEDGEPFDLASIKAKPIWYLRQRIQYMHTGKLKKVKFYCKNYAVPAALDRLPTARVISAESKRSLIEAEVYGSIGITMWLGSQGEAVELVEMKDAVVSSI